MVDLEVHVRLSSKQVPARVSLKGTQERLNFLREKVTKTPSYPAPAKKNCALGTQKIGKEPLMLKPPPLPTEPHQEPLPAGNFSVRGMYAL